LGNGEVTLFELTRAFSVFASGGYYRSVNFINSINGKKIITAPKRVRIFKPAVAYIISDILNDNNARSPAFGEFSPLNMPFFCPVKTGTSKDYRDNWCIGYTSDYLVGIWVGNFDGSPMNQVSGITGAAPIFRDIMLFLHRDLQPTRPAMPESVISVNICALSGKIPGRGCENVIGELFIKGKEPLGYCDHQTAILEHYKAMDLRLSRNPDEKNAFRIVFPDNGDIYKIDPVLRNEYQELRLRIATDININQVSWFIDGEKIGTENYPYSHSWQLIPGDHVITATAFTESGEEIQSASVSIVVLE
jgi:penicillin-binding protein 1C